MNIDVANVAAGHLDCVGTVAEPAEVDREWSVGAIEFAEGADAVAGTGGEDAKVGSGGKLLTAFEFCRSDEPDTDMGDRLEGGS